jgi:hypothetical protein
VAVDVRAPPSAPITVAFVPPEAGVTTVSLANGEQEEPPRTVPVLATTGAIAPRSCRRA